MCIRDRHSAGPAFASHHSIGLNRIMLRLARLNRRTNLAPPVYPPANNSISREEVVMERRMFLAGAAGAAVAAAGLGVRSAAADTLPLGDLPNWRYPDPRVEVLDKRFKYK